MHSRGPAPRLLPWADWEEWDHVRRWLFSDSPQHKEWAVGVVSMWRRRGRVPHAVESTAQLLEIGLGDPCSSMGGRRADRELRLSYSLAVVRAVNGLVDPQQQNYFAGSVLALAAKIGIPGWIVELRHDATHNDMPSLSVLRNAAFTLLAWYEKNYWLQQAEHLRNLSGPVISQMLSPPSGDETRAQQQRFLPVTSFTHIIIPQLISDITYFELECPAECKLFDIFSLPQNTVALTRMVEDGCGQLSAWFANCRWKNGVDDIIAASPEWGVDCLMGNTLSRVVNLLCDLNALDHNRIAESSGTIDLPITNDTSTYIEGASEMSSDITRQIKRCEWRIFVLTTLAAYTYTANNTEEGSLCPQWPFTTAILASHAMVQSSMLLPLKYIVNKVMTTNTTSTTNAGLSKKGKKRARKNVTSNINSKKTSSSSVVFEPLIWPLGSMPGRMYPRLYEVVEDYGPIESTATDTTTTDHPTDL